MTLAAGWWHPMTSSLLLTYCVGVPASGLHGYQAQACARQELNPVTGMGGLYDAATLRALAENLDRKNVRISSPHVACQATTDPAMIA